MAITMPVSVRPVTSISGGSVSSVTASEWYRVAVNGLGSPRSTPAPSWYTGEVFPCSSSGARSTIPPYTAPNAWCPRHTPKIGSVPAYSSISFMQMPARCGVPGPGESRTPAGRNRPTSATSISSLRRTSHSTPSCPMYCTRLNTNES
jgi:hypothetical protein